MLPRELSRHQHHHLWQDGIRTQEEDLSSANRPRAQTGCDDQGARYGQGEDQRGSRDQIRIDQRPAEGLETHEEENRMQQEMRMLGMMSLG